MPQQKGGRAHTEPRKEVRERILSHVKKYVEEKLFLKVNETKTKIVRAGNARTFLEIIGLSHPAVSDQAKKCADGQPY